MSKDGIITRLVAAREYRAPKPTQTTGSVANAQAILAESRGLSSERTRSRSRFADARPREPQSPEARPADTADTRRLDALERYVWALEELIDQAAPGAPLLRGTWRPSAYAGSATVRDVRRFRCSIRAWKSAALELRRWMVEVTRG